MTPVVDIQQTENDNMEIPQMTDDLVDQVVREDIEQHPSDTILKRSIESRDQPFLVIIWYIYKSLTTI